MRISRSKFSNCILRSLTSCVLVIGIILVTVIPVGLDSMEVYAAGQRVLTLEQARELAVANSDTIDVLEARLEKKNIAYDQAVKSIELKKKDMSTFRYSPLLNFKFPTKPDMAESYEFTYKPLSIQIEIEEIRHSIADQKIEEYRKVNEQFTKIVGDQEEIAFTQERIDALNRTLSKNKARLKLGQANKSDIDTMEAKVKQLTNELTQTERELESAKKTLSKLIDMDVSTGYEFENPFLDAEIPRDALESLVQYTLDNDQSYFEACKTAVGSKVSVQTYYGLIQSQYKASDVNIIAPYVNRVLNDNTLSKKDTKAFKTAYKQFLSKINEPWTGSYKIRFLFFSISIPKELFKGDLDGDRYVEDDPYSLEESALQYQEDRISKEKLESDLTSEVEASYETYIDMRNAYRSYKEQIASNTESLKKDQVLNRIGQMSYEDYASAQESLDDLQNDTRAALEDYSNQLYELDRLTCGGVSSYLSGDGLNTFVVGDGTSNIEPDNANGAYYYFNSIVQQQMFELTIHLPDDFTTTLTDFELWCDGIQIGDRTPINKALRHLTLTTEDVSDVKIIFYNGGKWVCDCDVDPSSISGPLDIITGYTITDADKTTVGSYSTSINDELGLVTISFKPDEKEKIAFFRLSIDGKYIDGDEKKDVNKPFKYLVLISDSLSDVVCFGVLPAIIGYRLGLREWYYLIIIVFFPLAALIRLAWFNVLEITRNSNTPVKFYTGLPVTSSALLFPLVYALKSSLGTCFTLVYGITLLVVGILFITKLKIKKPSTKTMIILIALGVLELILIFVVFK